jgi:hypothetical protein
MVMAKNLLLVLETYSQLTLRLDSPDNGSEDYGNWEHGATSVAPGLTFIARLDLWSDDHYGRGIRVGEEVPSSVLTPSMSPVYGVDPPLRRYRWETANSRTVAPSSR